MSEALLVLHRLMYERLARPLIFRMPAQTAHERTLRLLAWMDRSTAWREMLARLHRAAFHPQLISVGGVHLPRRLILAAGLVKGEGFESEDSALAAVQSGRNIIPGWRAVPALVGLVELGSFTRYPRIGNPGTVVWRDAASHSTQNRVGLRNPGAKAAAAFLALRRSELPPQFGINLAVSPGVSDADQEARETVEAFEAFLDADIIPTWFTLNISCPNTEDDPSGRQTEQASRRLCAVVIDRLSRRAPQTPLWVKVSPCLSRAQYAALMRAFEETGVRAVIATNTLPQPAPGDSSVTAGVGGGRLHQAALEAARVLLEARVSSTVDVIGCGGVLDGRSYANFRTLGIEAVQYWSALIYRGPLAGAVIEREGEHA